MKIPYCSLLLGPTALYALGFTLNALVMAANGNQMPVLVPGGCNPITDMAEDSINACMVASTHLKFLADWIVVRHTGVASIGDFFEWAANYSFWPSLAVWIGFILKDHNQK
jgi:hypothetical protein